MSIAEYQLICIFIISTTCSYPIILVYYKRLYCDRMDYLVIVSFLALTFFIGVGIIGESKLFGDNYHPKRFVILSIQSALAAAIMLPIYIFINNKNKFKKKKYLYNLFISLVVVTLFLIVQFMPNLGQKFITPPLTEFLPDTIDGRPKKLPKKYQISSDIKFDEEYVHIYDNWIKEEYIKLWRRGFDNEIISEKLSNEIVLASYISFKHSDNKTAEEILNNHAAISKELRQIDRKYCNATASIIFISSKKARLISESNGIFTFAKVIKFRDGVLSNDIDEKIISLFDDFMMKNLRKEYGSDILSFLIDEKKIKSNPIKACNIEEKAFDLIYQAANMFDVSAGSLYRLYR